MVPALEYADTAAAACKTSRSRVVRSIAPFARGFTEVVLLVYMIGVCSVYVLFVKENLKQVLTLENQMKDPTNFLKGCGVLNFAMAIIAILYILMGSLGYLAYGEKTKGSITLNLPPNNT
ncbi:proton-coupled amino acid transporter 1-like [Schistocerca nitens]|uniref:proton-coupled amino acid transporter 1-like n=1 Tax=Schistocerca nitens TaxID=7011 RepID=UPI002118702B|nr:proton-coupled amino acid transporter 1-like [Schistocerca nitens]